MANEQFLRELRALLPDPETIGNLVYADIPPTGYAVPMTLQAGIEVANSVARAVPNWSSADHGSVLKAVSTVFSRIQKEEIPFEGPFFDASLRTDPVIEECIRFEYGRIYYLDLDVSVENGYYEVLYEKGVYSLRLRPSLRRSALHVLSVKADFLSYKEDVQTMLRGGYENIDPVDLTIRTALDELAPFTSGVKDAWEELMHGAQLENAIVVNFQAFCAYLRKANAFWFRGEDLWVLWQHFAEEYHKPAGTSERFDVLLGLFSDSPRDLLVSGLPVPLIKFGDWYAFWPFFNHVMHPNLAFISLLMRKQQQQWSRTVGAHAAEIAHYLRDQFPRFDNVSITSVRVKKGVGDIDLALYDVEAKHLLLCEVKTVFDRFRTRYQLTNYQMQRVNFDRANKQLRDAKAAIQSGAWRLNDIVPVAFDEIPARISLMILTWWDISNANIGGPDEDILVCNFKTFRYLYTESGGDITGIVESIDWLARVYCPGAWVSDRTHDDAGALRFRVLKQTDVLPPDAQVAAYPIPALAKRVTEDLPRFPAEWREQMVAQGEDPAAFDFWD